MMELNLFQKRFKSQWTRRLHLIQTVNRQFGNYVDKNIEWFMR